MCRKSSYTGTSYMYDPLEHIFMLLLLVQGRLIKLFLNLLLWYRPFIFKYNLQLFIFNINAFVYKKTHNILTLKNITMILIDE